jgi:biopolymer transport protein TolQ
MAPLQTISQVLEYKKDVRKINKFLNLIHKPGVKENNFVEMHAVSAQGMSFWGLFVQADWIVKIVILMLFGASIASWGVIFSKWFMLRQCNQEADETIGNFSDASMEKIDGRFTHGGSVHHMVNIAAQEWRRIKTFQAMDHRQLGLQRLEQLLNMHMDQERDRMSAQMSVLASVGSTAAFVGLFGTVWGIMNSFQAIATSKNTSLAVVAPGIAEALFATAIGLLVAIPASVAYSKLTSSIQSYSVRMEIFAQELLAWCMRI